MSAVLGIDLSSHAIDLIKLDEDTNAAEWTRVELEGKTAWDRTLQIPSLMPTGTWWDDTYLVAIEAPYGRGQAGTTAILNRVVGAIAASLPPSLRVPERCWLVPPHEWKAELGLKAKPTGDDVERLAPGHHFTCPSGIPDIFPGVWQNGRDAYCIALYARSVNARGIEAA